MDSHDGRGSVNRVRVLMVGPHPRSLERIDGGVAAAMTYLSSSLAAEQQIDLIGVRITDDLAGGSDGTALGWPVVDLPLGPGSVSTLYLRQRRRFRQLLDQIRPDLVHAQGVDLAGMLAVGTGLPAVVTVHGILSEDAKYLTDKRTRMRARFSGLLTEKTTVRRATDLISISPYVTRHYGGDIRGRVHEIPNPVAPSFFGVQRAGEPGRLLYAGRIIPRKGVLDLVRAVARSRDAVSTLVLAGSVSDPVYGAAVRREIENSGLAGRVHFAGLLSEPALLEEFARAEALVLPSYQETAPMVIQQAMAAGLTVIASNVCGIPHQIEHEVTGLLFDPGNVTQLSSLLSRLGAEPSLSRALGCASKSVATARFHASKVAAATRRAYDHALVNGRIG